MKGAVQQSTWGLSLTEVMLALGLFAIAGVALLGLIGVGLKVTGDVKSDYGVVLVEENIRSQFLISPEWPGKELITYCDEVGSQVEKEKAAYELVWAEAKHDGWNSKYFDVRSVTVRHVNGAGAAQVLLLGRALAEPAQE